MLRKLTIISLLGWAAISVAAVPVHVVSVIQKNLPEELHSTGMVMGSLVSFIQTEVSGRVDTLPLRVGDPVKKGQVVATIDATLSKATLAQAKAQQRRLSALISGQQIAVNRTRTLYKGEAATKTKLQAAETKLKELQAEKAGAAANVTKARYGYELTSVRATADGVIHKVEVSPGNVVDAGHKLYMFTSRDVLKALLPFSEQVRVSVRVGQKVLLRSHIKNVQTVNASINSIIPMANPVSRTFEAVSYFKNPGYWQPGSSVVGIITLQKARPVFLVPNQSIVVRHNQPSVFIVKNNKAQLRVVSLGSYYHNRWIQVLKGLAQNEKVVTEGAAYLVDGDIVKVTG
jgi:membrane fusion protein, multidrug efflux system